MIYFFYIFTYLYKLHIIQHYLPSCQFTVKHRNSVCPKVDLYVDLSIYLYLLCVYLFIGITVDDVSYFIFHINTLISYIRLLVLAVAM